MNLANAGATILVYKNMPQDVPGIGQLEKRRQIFNKLVNTLKFTELNGVKKAITGKGAILISDELGTLMEAGKARQEPLAEKGLSAIRRKINNETFYFINNRNDKAFDDWVEIREKFVSVVLFDPMTGKAGLANKWVNKNGFTEIQVQLQPHESVIIQTYNTARTGKLFPYKKPIMEPQELKGGWTIDFLSGGPALPASITTPKLSSWTEMGKEETKHFSGTAKYSTSFDKPAGPAASWILDLGKVHETAEVFLNGKKISTLIGPVFQCVIPAADLLPNNKLEVIVANLMANRIIYMDQYNQRWKIFYNTNMPARRKENSRNGLFDASGWKPLPSGIVGPVTLTGSGTL
jgi:hypothetical protein